MSEKDVFQGFYGSLRKTFFALRLIGVFPVTGLLNRNSKLSRCSWITPYTLYLVITITSLIGLFLVHLWYTITSTPRFKDLEMHENFRLSLPLGGLIIHGIVSLALIFIVRLSFNWRKLMDKIDGIEKQLPPFKNGCLVVKTINRIMVYLALFSLVDYAINLIVSVRILHICLTHKSIKEEFTVEKYFIHYFGWYFDVLPYNSATAAWSQIIKTQAMFIFGFVDAVVIAVTLYLIFRFRNFNRLMRQKMKKCNQNTKWCDVQAHYTRLTRLVKVIDDEINPFVFISFLSSIVFICKLIYDFIREKKTFFDNLNNDDCGIRISSDIFVVVYKLSGFSIRFLKALSVSILTSHLHSISRQPLEALHTLPAPAYNFELQRFMDQVYYTKVCLSGLQFFYVTRGTILSMFSSIITYELVLLQLPVPAMY